MGSITFFLTTIFLVVVTLQVAVGESDAAKKCPRHEVWGCVAKCIPERTCENRDKTFKCKPNEKPSCQLKCICDSGYYRDTYSSNKMCITKQECEKKYPVCPQNEVHVSCIRCPDTCDSDPRRCHPPKPIACRPGGCQCKPGYLRLNGKCIPKKWCPQYNSKS